MCESWNYGFQQLVSHTNPSVWTIIDSMHKDQALVATTLLQAEQEIKAVKRVNRVTIDLQDRLHNLCQEFNDGTRNVEKLLRGVGNCIRL